MNFKLHVQAKITSVNLGDVGQFNELQDLTGVTHYDVSIAQIHKLADHYESYNPENRPDDKRIAYIAPGPAAFGTGRVYSALIEIARIDMQVFTDLEEGANWLGLSPDNLDRLTSGPTTPFGSIATQ